MSTNIFKTIKILFFSLFLISSTLVFSQKKLNGFVLVPTSETEFEGKKIKVEAFYILETEVTNAMYQEFLDYLLKNKKTSEYSKVSIDTNLWKIAKVTNGDYYAANYHHWMDFPVVNISYDAAEMYCLWLTEKYRKEGLIGKQEAFRIPKNTEWVVAAKSNNANATFPFNQTSEEYYDTQNQQAQIKCLGNYWGPVKVKSFKPNSFGIYDLAGSVAEMISDQTIVKGGSWNTNLSQTKIDNFEALNISPMVGFRPVITYISE